MNKTLKTKAMADTETTNSMENFQEENDAEDNAVDEVAHEKLLNSLFALDGKTRNKNNVRGFSSQSGNLDLVVHAKRDQGKIKPQDLKLKARESSNLKKPMSAMETEQIKRQVARETINTEMTTWEPVVQEIRSAPQMIFNNRPHGIEMREAMTPKRFTPRTPLEKELFAALGQSEDVLNPNKELTRAEEKALKAMSMKEAMARRAELMKHHELLSRAQIRAKRVKKIKSKRYRKILRKEKEGTERKELEKLQQTDPEAFVERLEQLEKDRMEERLTLKHRGGGKFARLHKVYSKFDDKTREAMQDMLQKSRELTKKTENVSSSEDEGEEVDVAMVQDKASENVGDSDDESESKPKSTPMKISQLEMLKAINKKAGGWLDGPKSTFVYTDEKSQSATPANKSSDLEERLSGEQQSKDEDGDSQTSTSADVSEAVEESESKNKKSSKDLVKKRKLGDLNAEDDSDKEIEAPVEPKSKRRKKNKKQNENLEDDVITNDASTKRKVKAVPETTLETVDEAEAEEDEEKGSEDENDSLKVTMEELFQDEDVVEQFAKEKAAAEEKARPKFEGTRLPGWGSWAGPDYKGERPLTKKQKRAQARAKLLEKQQQKVKQPHVWLNPNRDDAVRKLQPKAVPFPYTSVQQYEASLRQPVSRGFVRETAFKLLNKPEVVTKLGHIIKPLDKEDIFKKKTTSEDVDVKSGTLATNNQKGKNLKDKSGIKGGKRQTGDDKRQQKKQKRRNIS